MKILSFTIPLFFALFTSLSASAQVARTQSHCGNISDKGQDDPPSDCPPTGGRFNAFSGNLHREVKDLEVWGSVGEIPLALERYGNSRGFRGWELRFTDYLVDDVNSIGQPLIIANYSRGGSTVFTQNPADHSQWVAPPGISKRLFQYGNDYYLQDANGHRYHFQKVTFLSQSVYLLKEIFDSQQNKYTLSYTNPLNPIQLTRVSEPAGRFLDYSWGTFNDSIVITKIQTSDGRSVLPVYQKFIDSNNQAWNVLKQVNYGDSTKAIYTYIAQEKHYAGARPYLEHAIDPRYIGDDANMRFTYDSRNTVGFLKEEKNGVTGDVMVTFVIDPAFKKVCYPNGRVQTLQFPDSMRGRLSAYTDGLNNRTSYVFENGKDGFEKTVTDPLGRVTTYNSQTIYGNPLEVTYPDGSKEKWTRDTLDLILTHTDELNRVTTYTRDAWHRITRTDYPDGSFETFIYNSFSQVLDHRKKNGGMEHFQYDARGLKTKFTDALGNITTYTYDGADRLASVTDARRNKIQYAYNERGLLIKQTNADLSFTTYTYDDFGNRTSMTNELGKKWTTVYDAFKRPVTVTDPLNRTTTYSYDLPGAAMCGCTHPVHHPTKITLPSGKITEIEYDVEWNKIRETVGKGTADEASTYFQYDKVGNLVATIDPKGKKWKTAYDVRNRKISSTDPLGNKTTWTYDATGNVLTMKRPDNGTTVNVYDNMNRQIQTTDHKAQVTKMMYDADGNMVKLTDPKNNAYSFEYDLLDRKTKMIYPDASFEAYGYDSTSNLKIYTNRAGNIRTYTYDNRNRELNSTWNDGLTPVISRSYDKVSRLLTMTSSVSALSYIYDDANQLTSETQAVTGGGGGKIIKYKYNPDGLRDSMTYPDGIGLRYSYNNRNLLATISQNSAPALATYSYDENANRINKVLNNGTATTYTYDDANRMLIVDHKKGGISFARFDYGYDNVNRRTFMKRDKAKGDVYAYDAIDQVTDVKYEVTNPEGAPVSPGRTVNYGLDAAGNRTIVTDNGKTTNYTTNNLNQYNNVGADALTYTANGSLKTYSGWTYTYDAQDRMTKAQKGATTVDFVYDAMNRCVKRTINGAATFFYYDDWNLLEERNSSNAVAARYVQGVNIDEILTKVSSANTIYYHHDALGSVVRLTGNTGNLLEQYSYDIFGTPLIKNNSGTVISATAFGNRFMFTGREYILEIGLYDYRNRIYSYIFGRFLQIDSLRFDAGDYNFYRYVKNSPINNVDPMGMFTNIGMRNFAIGLSKLAAANLEWMLCLVFRCTSITTTTLFYHSNGGYLWIPLNDDDDDSPNDDRRGGFNENSRNIFININLRANKKRSRCK